MEQILFLGKKCIKDKYYFEIYFYGAVKLVPVTKEDFDSCKSLSGQKMSFNDFQITCYNKGYDTVVSLKLK